MPMKIEELLKFRDTIEQQLLDPDCYPECPFKNADWKGLIFEDSSYKDTQSGAINDDDFVRISDATRKEFKDEHIFAITVSALDVIASPDRVFGWHQSPNSFEGYSQFKRDPHLIQYYLFGPSLKWLIFADHDWCILGSEASFIEKVVLEYGGWNAIVERLQQDFGTLRHDQPQNSPAHEWKKFVFNIWGGQRGLGDDELRRFAKATEFGTSTSPGSKPQKPRPL